MNTNIELDYKRPDTTLLVIDEELEPDDSVTRFTENWDSRRHILGSSLVGRVEDESPAGLESSGGLDIGRD